jgi:hypothetical protein
MTHGRLHLDQLTAWAGDPILRLTAVRTGIRTDRSITVAPLQLVVMTVTDAYEVDEVTAYRTADEAIEAAQAALARPDSRGIVREWRTGDGLPSGQTLLGPGGQLGSSPP